MVRIGGAVSHRISGLVVEFPIGEKTSGGSADAFVVVGLDFLLGAGGIPNANLIVSPVGQITGATVRLLPTDVDQAIVRTSQRRGMRTEQLGVLVKADEPAGGNGHRHVHPFVDGNDSLGVDPTRTDPVQTQCGLPVGVSLKEITVVAFVDDGVVLGIRNVDPRFDSVIGNQIQASVIGHLSSSAAIEFQGFLRRVSEIEKEKNGQTQDSAPGFGSEASKLEIKKHKEHPKGWRKVLARNRIFVRKIIKRAETTGLQKKGAMVMICLSRCPDGGIGRRAGFKIQFPRGSEGSTPSPGTISNQNRFDGSFHTQRARVRSPRLAGYPQPLYPQYGGDF